MSTFKDVLQRRERRKNHEKSRRRLRFGIGADMTPDAYGDEPVAIAGAGESESAPLRVALAERVMR